MSNQKDLRADQFELYDLCVLVEKIEGHCTCNMAVGDRFFLKGGKLRFLCCLLNSEKTTLLIGWRLMLE